jgi:hypothetical protein
MFSTASFTEILEVGRLLEIRVDDVPRVSVSFMRFATAAGHAHPLMLLYRAVGRGGLPNRTHRDAAGLKTGMSIAVCSRMIWNLPFSWHHSS